MNNKIIMRARVVLVLTVCVPLMLIYIEKFAEYFSHYHRLLAAIISLSGILCIIIAFIVGFSGIFNKKINNRDRAICIVCTSVCLAFFLYLFGPYITSPRKNHIYISCSSNLKNIYLALQQYAADYAGNYPAADGAAGLETLRKYDYLTDYAIYVCPNTDTMRGKDEQPLTEEIVDYVYIGGLNTKTDPNLLLVYDKPKNHGCCNALFADGIVKGITCNPWSAANIKK